MSRKELENCCTPLVGAELRSVKKLDHTWFIEFGSKVVVATESLWRLIDHGRIVVTSEDHGHQFGLPNPVEANDVLQSTLQGRPITNVSVAESTGDLTIEFGESTQLQFVQTSCGYESWRLAFGGTQLICTGGGEIFRFCDE